MFGFYFAKGDQEGWLAGAKGRKLLGHPGLGIDSRITHFQQSARGHGAAATVLSLESVIGS